MAAKNPIPINVNLPMDIMTEELFSKLPSLDIVSMCQLSNDFRKKYCTEAVFEKLVKKRYPPESLKEYKPTYSWKYIFYNLAGHEVPRFITSQNINHVEYKYYAANMKDTFKKNGKIVFRVPPASKKFGVDTISIDFNPINNEIIEIKYMFDQTTQIKFVRNKSGYPYTFNYNEKFKPIVDELKLESENATELILKRDLEKLKTKFKKELANLRFPKI